MLQTAFLTGDMFQVHTLDRCLIRDFTRDLAVFYDSVSAEDRQGVTEFFQKHRANLFCFSKNNFPCQEGVLGFCACNILQTTPTLRAQLRALVTFFQEWGESRVEHHHQRISLVMFVNREAPRML